MSERPEMPIPVPAAAVEVLPLSPAKGTLWPAALGWLMIVHGAGQSLSQAAKTAGMVRWYVEQGLGGSGLVSSFGFLEYAVIILANGYETLTCLLPLAGGLLLLRRRRAGRYLLLAWGVLRVAASLLLAGFMVWNHMSHASSPQPSSRWHEVVDVMLSAVPALLIGVLLPIGVMVWLLRPAVRRQVKTWRDPLIRQAERHAPPGSRWPGVLGIFMMVRGGAFLAGRAVGLACALIRTRAELTRNVPEVFERSAAWLVVHLVLAVLGIVAGRALYRRRPSGPVLAIVFATLAILSSLALPLAQILMSPRLHDMLGSSGILFMFVPSALGTAAFPAFLLIWFLRPPIREQVRAWRRAG